MSIFDRAIQGPLDWMFDLNKDGRLDSFEQGMEFHFLENDGNLSDWEDSEDPEDDHEDSD